MTYNSHPYIDEYFRLIESGEIPACNEQLLLKEFIKKILSRDDVYIDSEMVENSVEMPAKYFPYNLFPWQKFVNVFIFGLRWKKDDSLVFNRYFIYMGRGGGKNGYISFISLFMLSKKHGISNYNIDIVATSEEQAGTSFNDVYNVLEDKKNKKKLAKAFSRTKVKIQNTSTKSILKFNTSNARTKDGKRTGCVIFDEEHEYEDYGTIKVFTSGGGKVQDYREFHISTDGNVRGGPLDDLKEEARMVLNGEIPLEQTTLFPFICKLDDPDEVDNRDMWVKANPSLPYNSTLQKKMTQEYNQMQRNAAIRIEFMTKRMNSPVADARHEVATYEDRKATEQPFPEEMKGFDAVGGIDFADVRDFCSVGLLFKHGGKRYWMQHTFIHHMALKVQDINPDIIEIAKQKNLCTIVYDKSIDAERVLNWFLEQAKVFNIKKVACDNYRSTILKEKFKDSGLNLEVVRKGPRTHGMLAPLIDEMFIKQTIVFGDDPLMRWYVGNVYVDEKGNGNKEYCKIEPEKRKTDGFFAFTHALNFDGEIKELRPLSKRTFRARSY